MSIKSKLKIESTGMLLASVFYLAAGAICFFLLATNPSLIHIGIIGILSVITAYGVFSKRFWALWTATILFFMITVFSAVMLYYFFGTDVIIDLSFVAYLILTWISTAYLASKRENLAS
ncbi:MAG: hypothetical protein ACPL0C_00190 [Candidatus Bathyarchaeales archaeon]